MIVNLVWLGGEIRARLWSAVSSDFCHRPSDRTKAQIKQRLVSKRLVLNIASVEKAIVNYKSNERKVPDAITTRNGVVE